jgi:hypothetical protein
MKQPSAVASSNLITLLFDLDSNAIVSAPAGAGPDHFIAHGDIG